MCIRDRGETLPVCSQRGVAYSTFTIVKIKDDGKVYIAEFDNPELVLFRDNKLYPIEREELELGGKKIYVSRFQGQVGDMIVTFSDGVVHAGVGRLLDLGWQYDNIVNYLKENITPTISPRMLGRKLLGAVNTLYMDKPGDDSTVCAMRLKKSRPAVLMVGPPMNKDCLLYTSLETGIVFPCDLIIAVLNTLFTLFSLILSYN